MLNPDSSIDNGVIIEKNWMDVLLDLYDKWEWIHEDVETFSDAGHDTTAISFSWLIYALGRHPEIQQIFQAEIDEISKSNFSLMDTIRMLKCTKYVINESLRPNPDIYQYICQIPKGIVGKDDVVIAANTIVAIDVYSVLHNPEYWNNFFVFKAEGFGRMWR